MYIMTEVQICKTRETCKYIISVVDFNALFSVDRTEDLKFS